MKSAKVVLKHHIDLDSAFGDDTNDVYGISQLKKMMMLMMFSMVILVVILMVILLVRLVGQ